MRHRMIRCLVHLVSIGLWLVMLLIEAVGIINTFALVLPPGLDMLSTLLLLLMWFCTTLGVLTLQDKALIALEAVWRG